MKKYAIFTYYRYYPAGGWDDFCTSVDNLEDALRFVEAPENIKDHYQIVNIEEGYVVTER